MNKTEMITRTVETRIASASRELTAAKAAITGAFDLGYQVEASMVEKLFEAQTEYAFWSSMVKMVKRCAEGSLSLPERTAEKVEDIQDRLLNQGAGGSTSQVQNGKAEAERKVLLRAYKALSSL